MLARDEEQKTPLDDAVMTDYFGLTPCATILIANGVRLANVGCGHHKYITKEHRAFEAGILSLRTKVAAFLRVKTAGKLMRWDKFLLKKIALAVWATRYGAL